MIAEYPIPAQLSEPLWTRRGTTGLIALLRNIAPKGSGVLVPVNLCAIAVMGIVWAGMRPVFHDVSSVHGNAELFHLEQAYGMECKVVLAVHNFGRTLPIDEIADWAMRRELVLIEDVCNALGATYGDRPVGGFGDAAFYSFNHGKIVDVGAGGAITVRDGRLRRKVAEFVDGLPKFDDESTLAAERLESGLRVARNDHDFSTQRGLYSNYRQHALIAPPSNLPRRVGQRLAVLNDNVAHRRAIAQLYRHSIASTDVEHVASTPGAAPWRHNILVPAKMRDTLLIYLRGHGVPASAWYPPVDELVAVEPSGAFPGASQFARRVVNLWVDPDTTTETAERTAALVQTFFGAAA